MKSAILSASKPSSPNSWPSAPEALSESRSVFTVSISSWKPESTPSVWPSAVAVVCRAVFS